VTGPAADTDLRDTPVHRTVSSVETRFDGLIWSVRTDHVQLGPDETVVRDVIDHPGAVGILALDGQERVLLVQQYRHPVRSLLWEAPAGLLDLDDEPALEAAKRELHEEAGLRAARWDVLVDFFNSPGASSEAFRCYLARDLTAVQDAERHVGTGEERDMPSVWVPLDDAVGLVLAGHLHNPTAVAGILAAAAVRARGWADLRPADAPWPERFPD
jgi:ADP-ribose pyrophosphatase